MANALDSGSSASIRAVITTLCSFRALSVNKATVEKTTRSKDTPLCDSIGYLPVKAVHRCPCTS